MKNKIKNFFLGLLLVGLVAFLLGTGIYDLVNTKNRKTLNFIMATEILEVEHSINGLIPTGTDYYFLAVANEGGKISAYIVKGPKNWAEKHFPEKFDMEWSYEDTVLLKKVSKYDVEKELNARIPAETSGLLPYGASYALHVNYVRDAVGRIVLGVLAAFLIIGGVYAVKAKRTMNPKLVGVYIAAFFVVAIGIVFFLR